MREEIRDTIQRIILVHGVGCDCLAVIAILALHEAEVKRLKDASLKLLAEENETIA